MTDTLPKSLKVSTFTLFGQNVECHQLDNGARIIEAGSMERLVEAMGRDSSAEDTLQQSEFERFARWLNSGGQADNNG